jgi:hypothetical protein
MFLSTGRYNLHAPDLFQKQARGFNVRTIDNIEKVNA